MSNLERQLLVKLGVSVGSLLLFSDSAESIEMAMELADLIARVTLEGEGGVEG